MEAHTKIEPKSLNIAPWKVSNITNKKIEKYEFEEFKEYHQLNALLVNETWLKLAGTTNYKITSTTVAIN